MERRWGYSERSDMRKRAVKRVNDTITSLDRDTPDSSRVDRTQEDSVVASCSGATRAFADACGSEEEVDCEIGSSSSDSGSEDLSHSDLRSCLSDGAVEFGVSLVALSALLSILRVHHPFLPKDGRSLLKTRTEYVVEKIAGLITDRELEVKVLHRRSFENSPGIPASVRGFLRERKETLNIVFRLDPLDGEPSPDP
ncbi:hypothetical protein SRHO_G00142380 [Serrasalmus rhombeus]